METCDATEQDPPEPEPPGPSHQIFIANEQSTLVIDEVEVPRSINSKGGSRGKIKELLIHYHR